MSVVFWIIGIWLLCSFSLFGVLVLCRNKSVYIICPVRNLSPEQQQEIDRYVEWLEDDSYLVYYPPRDVDQTDSVDVNIIRAHRRVMKKCGRVDVFWDVNSRGSHFDLCMAIAYGKPLRLIKAYQPDNEGKSFLKVIQKMQA